MDQFTEGFDDDLAQQLRDVMGELVAADIQCVHSMGDQLHAMFGDNVKDGTHRILIVYPETSWRPMSGDDSPDSYTIAATVCDEDALPEFVANFIVGLKNRTVFNLLKSGLDCPFTWMIAQFNPSQIGGLNPSNN